MIRLMVVLVCILLAGCISDAPFKFRGPDTPAQLNDGWTVTLPESVGVQRSVLDNIHERFISEDQFFNARSLLIVKSGKLIFEAFTQGSQLRDRYQHVQSVTKSVTSIVFGMAYADGYIDSLDQLLSSILPDKFPDDPAKRHISLRHLLTMRSGIQFDNDVFSVEIHADRPDDPIRYILEKGMYNAPGAEFYYRDCDPHLISAVLHRKLGRSLKSYAVEKLFGPLGITDFYWIADPAGITSAAHGLHIRPRDMAKLGQLMLDNGRWNGMQVVDSAWVAVSTSQQTTIGPQEGTNFSYGYYWWIIPDRQAFSAWGHGGNFIFVQPSADLVAVITSFPDAGDDVGPRLEDFEELIRSLLQ